ncbi:MAG: ATP-binding cassette domain-containing protein [Myxococcota bacterium]
MKILDGVDLELAAGEVRGLIGPSGAGKTTLGRVLGGLQQPSSGRIIWDGQPVEWPIRPRHLCAYVHQSAADALDPAMTAGGLLEEAWSLGARTAPLEMERRLRELDLGAELAQAGVERLSGGQRQRLALARILAIHPRLIVLDEPFSAVDASTSAVLEEALRRELAQGLAVLLIAHELGPLRRLTRRAELMWRGRRVESMDLDNPRHPVGAAWLRAARAWRRV